MLSGTSSSTTPSAKLFVGSGLTQGSLKFTGGATRVRASHVNVPTELTSRIVRHADLLALVDVYARCHRRGHMNIDRIIPVAALDFNVVRWHILACTRRIALSSRAIS